MAAPNPVRIIPSTSGNMRAGGEYVIRDEFTTDRAAGAVNGTAAEPGPGVRTVVDTGSRLTIAGGALTFATGGGSGDPGLWLNGVARTPGRMLFAAFTPTSGRFYIGWDNNQSADIRDSFSISGTTGIIERGSGNLVVLPALSFVAGTPYLLAAIQKATGYFYFVKGGAFTNWTLVWRDLTNNYALIYPGTSSESAVFSVSYLRVPLARWLPIPLCSHGFGSAFGTSDGLGHAEGVAGGIGAGGSGVTFSNAGATWSVSAGKAINTPTLGADLVTNGNFSAWTGDNPDGWTLSAAEDANNYWTEASGKARNVADGVKFLALRQILSPSQRWVKLTATCTARVSGDLYTKGNNISWLMLNSVSTKYSNLRTNAADGVSVMGYMADMTIDNVSALEFSFTELVSLSNLACSDVLAGVAITISPDVMVFSGLALNWDSSVTPANGVLVYNTGQGRINVDKCVAGVWSLVSTTTITYSAGARLVVQKSGTEYRTYYNNALVKADTITDAGIITNFYHGLFSTDPSSGFDDLCIYAIGSSGEYNALNAF